MSNDPWSIFNPQPVSQAAQSVAPVDPWAAFNPKPVSQGTTAYKSGQDLGAQSAFSHGILTGVPILGPLLEKAEGYVGSHIGSAISGKPVDQVLAEGQALGNATSEAHPVASAAGGVVGATMALGPAVEAAPGFFGAKGGLTVGNVLKGYGSGAAIGGADAVARGESPEDIVQAAALGGAGGAAGPYVGAALGHAVPAVADEVARQGALKTVGVSAPAADVLLDAAQSSGALTGAGAKRIASGGPDAMLADAGGTLQDTLDATLKRGGPDIYKSADRIEERATKADADITDALDTAFGKPVGIKTSIDDIRNSTAPVRNAAYDSAYSTPIDYSGAAGQSLEDIVKTQVPAPILARANNLMRIYGEKSSQILAQVADDGAITYSRLPDVRQLDYIKRALQDVGKRGDGQGALGGNTTEGAGYMNLARTLRNNLRQAVPEYGHALETAADAIDSKEAVEFGQGLLSGTVPRDVATETIRSMSQPEVRLARQGMRSQLAEKIANVTRVISDPNIDARQAALAIKELSSDAVKEKIGLLISRNEQDALNTRLERAARALELRAGVARNSATAVRTMVNKKIGDAVAPGALGKAAQGEPINAVKRGVQFLTRTRPVDLNRKEEAIAAEIAQALTANRGQDAMDFLTRLQTANQTRVASHARVRNLPYGQAASTGILGSILGSRAR